jgi:DNA polymerase I
MEQAGIGVDVGLLTKLSSEYARELELLRTKIFEAAGTEFNMNSPKQLGEILFTRLGLSTKGVRRTKTGISTDSAVLEKLKEVHPLPALILQHRMIFKLKSTYLDALASQLSARSGRLHSTFHQTVTGTGRLSSSDPNLQNIPIQTAEGRKIRRAFVTDKGKLLISADYSQIELRLLAHMSRDEQLVEAFTKGIDIHARTARQIFGVAAEDLVTSEMRRVGKTINFGLVYGMGPYRLGQELGIPLAVASQYIESYFRTYPQVKRFFAEVEKDVLERGYVSTLFGRRRVLSDLDTSGRDKGFVVRAAMNAPLQGTAADIIKLAMIRIATQIEEKTLPLRMLLQIHDELVLECEAEKVDEMKQIVKYEMEHVGTEAGLEVPLQVEVGSGFNWEEAHQ